MERKGFSAIGRPLFFCLISGHNICLIPFICYSSNGVLQCFPFLDLWKDSKYSRVFCNKEYMIALDEIVLLFSEEVRIVSEKETLQQTPPGWIFLPLAK